MSKKFLINLLKYVPTRLLPAITGFITIPIISRIFPPAEYGEYILAVSLVNILLGASCSGYGSGAIRYYPEYLKRSDIGKFFAAINSNLLPAVFLVSILYFLILNNVSAFISVSLAKLLYVGILLFIGQAIFDTYLQILRAQEKSGLYTIFDLFIRYGTFSIALFLIFVYQFDLSSMLWGEFLCYAIGFPLLFSITIQGGFLRLKDFSLEETKQMFRYAWPVGFGNIAMWSLIISDRYVIGYFRPESEVGLYSMSYQITEKSINIIVDTFRLSVMPVLMNTWETEGREETEKIMTFITRVYLIFCLPACVGLAVIGEPLVSLLTAEEYHEGYKIVGYIAFSGFFLGMAHLAMMGLLIGKKTNLIAFNQIAATLLNIGLNIILIPKFGFVVAGMTTLIGFALLFVLQAYQSRLYLKWRFPFSTSRNVIIASGLMGISTKYIMQFASDSASSIVLHLGISISLAIIVYFGALVLLKETNKEELEKIKKLRIMFAAD